MVESQSYEFALIYQCLTANCKQALGHLGKKLPAGYASILQQSCQQLQTHLQKDPQKALRCFYQDIINHVIQLSGQKISFERFQKALSYYQALVPAPLYAQVLKALTGFREQQSSQKQKDLAIDLYDENLNKLCYQLIKTINAAFKVDLQAAEHVQVIHQEQNDSGQALGGLALEIGAKTIKKIRQHPQWALWGNIRSYWRR